MSSGSADQIGGEGRQVEGAEAGREGEAELDVGGVGSYMAGEVWDLRGMYERSTSGFPGSLISEERFGLEEFEFERGWRWISMGRERASWGEPPFDAGVVGGEDDDGGGTEPLPVE